MIVSESIGTPIDQRNLLRDYYSTLEKAGLPRIRLHDLRHTDASLMLNHNILVLVVSKILGHSKPSVTLDIYGHLYMEMQDESENMNQMAQKPLHTVAHEKRRSAL